MAAVGRPTAAAVTPTGPLGAPRWAVPALATPVRRIPDVNTEENTTAGQETLFDVWRFHAFFTTAVITADPGVLDTMAADKAHAGTRSSSRSIRPETLRAHALPSGVFTAHAALLVRASALRESLGSSTTHVASSTVARPSPGSSVDSQ